MAPQCNNPVKLHMQRQCWSTDRQFTHCADPVTWATATTRRHKVVQQRSTIAQTTAQKRKQNHANTSAHQKTSSQHNKKVLSRMSVNTSTHPKNLAQRSIRVVLLHRVATHIDKDHQRQHVIGIAQDVDTETIVRGHRELRQYTWRTDAREHQSSVSNPLRKTNTHEVCPSNDVRAQNRTHMAQTPPQTKQLCFAVRRCTSQFSTKPHRLCLSNDNASTRHGKSLPETQIMTGA